MPSWLEIAQSKEGPDYFLYIRFDRSLLSKVLDKVHSIHFNGFTLVEKCLEETVGNSKLVEFYVDSDHTGEIYHSPFLQNTIKIYDNQIVFESRYGFAGSQGVENQMEMLDKLFFRREIEIEQWTIGSGGDGYGFETVSEGQSSDSLCTILGVF